MSVYNIVPKQGYLLIEPLTEEQESSAISLPDDFSIETTKGRIITIAKQGKFIPETNSYEILQYRPDSVVWFKQNSQQEIKYQGKTYLFIDQNSVIAEWEDKAE